MTTITVFQTDADGAYIHETQAHELTLEPGVFNVPYGASLIAPPQTDADHVAVAINGDAWVVMTDHRSAKLYRRDNDELYERGMVIGISGQAHRYSGLGDIPSWLTDTPPAPPEKIEPQA